MQRLDQNNFQQNSLQEQDMITTCFTNFTVTEEDSFNLCTYSCLHTFMYGI